jgi:hypothetical protein
MTRRPVSQRVVGRPHRLRLLRPECWNASAIRPSLAGPFQHFPAAEAWEAPTVQRETLTHRSDGREHFTRWADPRRRRPSLLRTELADIYWLSSIEENRRGSRDIEHTTTTA